MFFFVFKSGKGLHGDENPRGAAWVKVCKGNATIFSEILIEDYNTVESQSQGRHGNKTCFCRALNWSCNLWELKSNRNQTEEREVQERCDDGEGTGMVKGNWGALCSSLLRMARKRHKKKKECRTFYVGETAPLITGSLLRYVAQ